MQGISGDRDGDFFVRLIVHYGSLPCSLEKLQFCIGWLIDNAFAFGGEWFACVSGERGDDENDGDDMSK